MKKIAILSLILIISLLAACSTSANPQKSSTSSEQDVNSVLEESTTNESISSSIISNSDISSSTVSHSSSATQGENRALQSAKKYLDIMSFSKTGLIKQLEFEGFSNAEATYAAEHCEADWNEQAVKSAEKYMDMMSFSYEALIEQLEFEGFTSEQATYGADNVYNTPVETSSNTENAITIGQQNALGSAETYLKTMPFSYENLIRQLEFEGYTKEEATYAADHCGADWNEQAAKAAKQYLSIMPFSRQSLIDQLEFDGFTSEQAIYGAEQNGL